MLDYVESVKHEDYCEVARDLLAAWMTLLWTETCCGCVWCPPVCVAQKSQKTSCSCRDAGGGYLRPVPALFAHLQLRMANKRMPFFSPPSHQCLNSLVTASVEEKLLLICRLIREGSVTNSLLANAILFQEKILSLCACGCVGGCVCLGGCLCVCGGVWMTERKRMMVTVYLSTIVFMHLYTCKRRLVVLPWCEKLVFN